MYNIDFMILSYADVESALSKYIQQCLQLNNLQTLIGASMATSWTSTNFSSAEIFPLLIPVRLF